MEEKNQLTPYDEMMQTKELQMLKTVVPFLAPRQQQQIAMLIPYMELRHCMKLFSTNTNALAACEIPEGSDRKSALLMAIKNYCSPKEKEMIDTVLNLFCMMDNYELFFNPKEGDVC